MDQENVINHNYHRLAGKGGKGRLYSFLVLIAAGVVMVCFGSLRSLSPSNSVGSANQTIISEMELNPEIAVGGIMRSETGEIEKTYQEGEKPPQACPT